MTRTLFALLCLLPLWLAACPGFQYNPQTPASVAKRGREIYSARNLGTVPYACIDCHPDTPDDPQEPGLTAGHSLYNVTARPSWYGGKFKTRAAQGAQECVKTYLKGQPLTADELDALQLYLQTLSPARNAPALPAREPEAKPLTIPEGELADAAQHLGVEGEAAVPVSRGFLLYTAACALCHDPARGTGPKERDLVRRPEDLIEIVRRGKGTMPALSPARISDADLTAIAVYLRWRASTP
jgi:mono/diheme cytochrome c family protein